MEAFRAECDQSNTDEDPNIFELSASQLEAQVAAEESLVEGLLVLLLKQSSGSTQDKTTDALSLKCNLLNVLSQMTNL